MVAGVVEVVVVVDCDGEISRTYAAYWNLLDSSVCRRRARRDLDAIFIIVYIGPRTAVANRVSPHANCAIYLEAVLRIGQNNRIGFYPAAVVTSFPVV